MANGVVVAPVWGPEVRFPVPTEMLDSATYVSNPTLEERKAKRQILRA